MPAVLIHAARTSLPDQTPGGSGNASADTAVTVVPTQPLTGALQVRSPDRGLRHRATRASYRSTVSAGACVPTSRSERVHVFRRLILCRAHVVLFC